MKVVRLEEVKPDYEPRPIFDGRVSRQPLVTEDMAQTMRIAAVTFSPGARTKLHTHTHDQILFVVAGKGILATERKTYVVTPGTTVFVPQGERHWHGATEDMFFTHLSIATSGQTDIVE